MAAEIVQQRNQMMADGRRELDTMKKRLEEEARKMLSKTEIMQQARARAKEIVGNAEIQAKELRRAANEYCEDSLKRTEEALSLSSEELKKARARFRSAAKNG